MHHLYLDPLLFACPPASEGQEGFDSFLQGILLLRDLQDENWSQLFITATTCDVLYEAGLYPLQNDLHAAIKMFASKEEKEEIQARDVIEIVNSLLQKLPTLENYLGITTLLFDDVIISPEIDFSGRKLVLKDAFINLLVFCVLVTDLKSLPEAKQISLTRGLRQLTRKVSIEAEIFETEGETTLSLPYKADSGCWLCQNWDDLHQCLDPEELWMSEPVGSFQKQALATHASRESIARGNANSELIKWRFGSEFLATALALGFLHTPQKIKTILRACAEAILQINMKATHPLRTGKGGNDSQRMRGRDKAWRRDIDHEFHLHYWETSSGIEFASVVVHNDFSIP